MPPSLYNKHTGGKYLNKDEMLVNRKKKDNEQQKLRYWRKKYKYDLKSADYEQFNKNVHLIKHIYDIHDFFINWHPDNEVKTQDIGMFIKKHNYIKEAYHIQDYIKSLKKIQTENKIDETVKPEKYIIEF